MNGQNIFKNKNNRRNCDELKYINKESIHGYNEKTTEQLDEENSFNMINKRLINMIINKIKNKGNGNASIKDQNISEKFISQFLKCVKDSISILLDNKKECYAMQTKSQLKNSENINMDKNEDNIKNKLFKNIEVTNKSQKKRVRQRKIIY